MSDTILCVLFLAAIGIIYWIVSSIGEKIVKKGGDAIKDAYKRRKK